MSLEAAADVATIVASSGVVYGVCRWLWDRYLERHPFKLTNASFTRFRQENSPAYFSVQLRNRLPYPIKIYEASFMAKPVHRIDEINGKCEASTTVKPIGEEIRYSKEDPKEINQGSNWDMLFKYRTAKEAEKARAEVHSISLYTDRGGFHIPIKSFVINTTRVGSLTYSARSTTLLGKWFNQLHHWWWKNCLKSPKTKAHFCKNVELDEMTKGK